MKIVCVVYSSAMPMAMRIAMAVMPLNMSPTRPMRPHATTTIMAMEMHTIAAP